MLVLLSLSITLVMGFFGVIKPLQFYVRLLVFSLLVIVAAIYGMSFTLLDDLQILTAVSQVSWLLFF